MDTQLILYDRDGQSILLFQDNINDLETVDLLKGWPYSLEPCDPDIERTCNNPDSEIVWEAEYTGTYYVKVRTATCDEDLDTYCNNINLPVSDFEYNTSPDGVGLNTEYTVTLEEY